MLSKIQPYAKFIAALIGTALTAGTTLIPAEGLEYLAFIGALITAVAVYAVPNRDPERVVAVTLSANVADYVAAMKAGSSDQTTP